MQRLRRTIDRTVGSEGMRELWRLLALYALLGVLAGLGAAGFEWLVTTVTEVTLKRWLTVPQGRVGLWPLPWLAHGGWAIAFLPMAGGLASGLVCTYLAPEAMGTGTDRVIAAYHRSGGQFRRRLAPVKALASTITLGTGGSAGVEGPVGLIAAGIGTILGRARGLSSQDRRTLMMAGFAAGIGAVFHAPMAAAVFSAEVLYRDMDIEHEVLVPAIIASTVSYGTFGVIHGWERLLVVPPVHFEIAELLPYSVLAIAVVAGGGLFLRILAFIKRRVGQWAAAPLWLRPAIGGGIVGLVGLVFPEALGSGYRIVQIALDGNVSLGLLAGLAVAKMVTSAATVKSGGSGGLFGPSIVIGGAIGGLVAGAVDRVAPELGVSAPAFVVVGMAGFFSAVINAPLSTVIMVSEIVGSYQLMVPALWVCTLAWLLGRGLQLYPEQVQSRLDAPFRLTEMMGAVLNRILVGDAMGPSRMPLHTVPPDLPMRDLMRHFAASTQSVFPILDDGRLIGEVDGRLLRKVIADQGVDALLIANDFQVAAVTVGREDTLYGAISLMTETGFDELLVVEDDRLIGSIARREIVAAYHARVLAGSSDSPSSGASEAVAAGAEGSKETPITEAMRLGGRFVRLKGHAPRDVIEELIKSAELPEECDRDELIRLLLAREELSGTALGHGVALPHPHADHIGIEGPPRILVGLTQTPIEWGAFDRVPVDVVLVLLVPSGSRHLGFLSGIARLLQDPALRGLLRNRAPRRRVLDRMREVEGGGAVD